MTEFIERGEPPMFIAVSRWGYGMDRCPAKAIMLSQEHVPLEAKPSQLLLYSATCVWEDEEEQLQPVGFKAGVPIWQNGIRPKLVGLTNTHQGWKRRPK